MARIPDVEIERLKKEVPIERLVMGFGVELKRHGVELIGTCPFHEDKTPSLVVRGVGVEVDAKAAAQRSADEAEEMKDAEAEAASHSGKVNAQKSARKADANYARESPEK